MEFVLYPSECGLVILNIVLVALEAESFSSGDIVG